MKRKGMLAGLMLLTGSLVTTASAKEYVVKVRDMSEMTFQGSTKVLDSHATGRLFLIDLPETSLLSEASEAHQLNTILAHENVEYVVPNIKFHVVSEPNDPEYSKQWALEKVSATKAWEMTKGSQDITVAVIDTGVDWQHEDLRANIWSNTKETPDNGIDDDNNGFIDDVRGWDFRDNDNNPMDATSSRNPGHGTHVAGIVNAEADNGVGIAGMAPHVKVMPIRFLGADGSGDLLTAAKAIDYAVQQNAQVINASWGAKVARAQVKPILEAIQRAEQKNIIFVAAAANSGANNDSSNFYPANAGFDNVISVAASNPQDGKPNWSNYGRASVSLAAPGEGILSTLPGNQYRNLSGTSMAAPLVAGAVALAQSVALENNMTMSPLAIRSVLQSTGNGVEIETACQCRIDTANALETIAGENLVVVPAALSLDIGQTKKFDAVGGVGPYTFSSSDAAVAEVSAEGVLKGVSKGEATIKVTDASGNQAHSQTLYIGMKAEEPSAGECPFPNPQMCDLMCQINPELPWCG